MARSESQGLQIAVILLTMCVVGLAISTWVFFQASDTHFKLKETADNTAKEKQKQLDREIYKVKTYQHIVGVPDATREEIDRLKTSSGGDATAESYLEMHRKVMEGHAEKAVAGEAKGLIALPDYLITSIGVRNEQLGVAANRETQLNVDKDAIDKRETGRTATAEQGMKKAADDLAAEREAFNTERADFKKNLAELEATIEQRNKQLKDLKDKADKDAADQIAAIQGLQRDLDNLRLKFIAVQQDGPSFEAPDGTITYVSQRQRVAWIDVGYADGLMRQTTFSVYSHDENGVSSAKPKGRLEVIRTEQPHLSECKILEDDIKNPILPGDKIFTPAWSPGQRLHFAINGALFIDQDSTPDNDEVRRIIELNGGVVDAELRPDGTISGKGITNQTRYLVRGKAPSEKDYEGEAGKRAFDNWSLMTSRAERYGVEIIEIGRFLNMMGWKAQDRTTTLGEKRTLTRRTSPTTSATKGAGKKPAERPATADPAEGATDEDPFE